MSNMVTLDTTDIVKFFDHVKDPVRAKLVTRTPVRMNKSDVMTRQIKNPYNQSEDTTVYKVQTTLVELNADYQGLVNNERVVEGKRASFIAQGLPWGSSENGSIIRKDDQLYLRTIEVSKIGEPHYEVNGQKISYAAFAQFVPDKSGSIRQGLVQEVQVRSYKLENVIGVNVEDKVRFIKG